MLYSFDMIVHDITRDLCNCSLFLKVFVPNPSDEICFRLSTTAVTGIYMDPIVDEYAFLDRKETTKSMTDFLNT